MPIEKEEEIQRDNARECLRGMRRGQAGVYTEKG